MLQASVHTNDQKTSEHRPKTEVRGTKRRRPATTPAMPAEMEYESSIGSR